MLKKAPPVITLPPSRYALTQQSVLNGDRFLKSVIFKNLSHIYLLKKAPQYAGQLSA